MNNTKVLAIGGSRNIGYFSSIRLLDLGATVTFLLRTPKVFDNDESIQKYIRSGKARLIQGDALVKDDVKRAWAEAAKGDDDKPVDTLLFTVGGTPHFELTKGFVISPPNLVTQSLINCLETLPSPAPKIITISSTGLTHASHQKLPLLLKPIYGYLLAVPHRDKCGAEEVVAHSAGWSWDAQDSPGVDILGSNWKAGIPIPGELKKIVVVRPAMLTDGECRADQQSSKRKKAYRVNEGDVDSSWTVSRKDVAHFLVEGVVKNWDEWEGKTVSIAY
ncbi:hypothetical protein HYDPIDRAFT_101173 [Hydnomerulius pinastri MD-312]|uniref:Unplaced genomic scaffold scaffold_60, whole genome shotgun sequence n=1 Tax=Hydnomerulius pinastri MD-312 TaxID=994086 RepID=A0A0C9VNH9_9AGAM|nr:hypothetical protein HYDPIDRAFT_101173 [Hydnomerulius pinastri MD-312]